MYLFFRGVEVRVMVLIRCLLIFRIFSVILWLYVCVWVCMFLPLEKQKLGFLAHHGKKVTYDEILSWEHREPKAGGLYQGGEEVLSFPEGSMSHSVKHFGRPKSELSRKPALRQFNLDPRCKLMKHLQYLVFLQDGCRRRCSNYFPSETESNGTVEEVP